MVIKTLHRALKRSSQMPQHHLKPGQGNRAKKQTSSEKLVEVLTLNKHCILLIQDTWTEQSPEQPSLTPEMSLLWAGQTRHLPRSLPTLTIPWSFNANEIVVSIPLISRNPKLLGLTAAKTRPASSIGFAFSILTSYIFFPTSLLPILNVTHWSSISRHSSLSSHQSAPNL